MYARFKMVIIFLHNCNVYVELLLSFIYRYLYLSSILDLLVPWLLFYLFLVCSTEGTSVVEIVVITVYTYI